MEELANSGSFQVSPACCHSAAAKPIVAQVSRLYINLGAIYRPEEGTKDSDKKAARKAETGKACTSPTGPAASKVTPQLPDRRFCCNINQEPPVPPAAAPARRLNRRIYASFYKSKKRSRKERTEPAACRLTAPCDTRKEEKAKLLHNIREKNCLSYQSVDLCGRGREIVVRQVQFSKFRAFFKKPDIPLLDAVGLQADTA